MTDKLRAAAQALINHYEFRKQYPAPPLDDSIEALRAALADPQTPDDLLRQSEREGWRYAREMESEVKRLKEADAVPQFCGSGHCSCVSCVKECEWTRDMELGCYETDCGESANSAGAATLCFNCGKKIKFLESEE